MRMEEVRYKNHVNEKGNNLMIWVKRKKITIVLSLRKRITD